MATMKQFINPQDAFAEDELLKKFFMAMQGGLTPDMTAPTPTNSGWVSNLLKGTAEGAYSTVSGLGEFGAMMGVDNSIAGSGEKFSNYLGKTSYERPKDFGFSNFTDEDYWGTGQAYRDIGQTVGSVASFLVPGMGVSKVVGGVGKLGKLGQAVVAGSTMAGLEAGTETGSTYQELIDKGVIPESAKEKGMQVFKENLGLLASTNIPEMALAMAGPNGKVLSSLMKTGARRMGTKVIGNGIMEGFQEKVQQAIQADALGQEYTPWNTLPTNWTPEEKYAAGLGAFGGGVIGVGVDRVMNRQNSNTGDPNITINDPQAVNAATGRLLGEEAPIISGQDLTELAKSLGVESDVSGNTRVGENVPPASPTTINSTVAQPEFDAEDPSVVNRLALMQQYTPNVENVLPSAKSMFDKLSGDTDFIQRLNAGADEALNIAVDTNAPHILWAKKDGSEFKALPAEQIRPGRGWVQVFPAFEDQTKFSQPVESVTPAMQKVPKVNVNGTPKGAVVNINGGTMQQVEGKPVKVVTPKTPKSVAITVAPKTVATTTPVVTKVKQEKIPVVKEPKVKPIVTPKPIVDDGIPRKAKTPITSYYKNKAGESLPEIMDRQEVPVQSGRKLITVMQSNLKPGFGMRLFNAKDNNDTNSQRLSKPLENGQIPVKTASGKIQGWNLLHTNRLSVPNASKIVVRPQVTIRLSETELNQSLKDKIEKKYNITPDDYEIVKVGKSKALFLTMEHSNFDVSMTGEEYKKKNLHSMMQENAGTRLHVQLKKSDGTFIPISEYHPTQLPTVKTEAEYDAILEKRKEKIEAMKLKPSRNTKIIADNVKNVSAINNMNSIAFGVMNNAIISSIPEGIEVKLEDGYSVYKEHTNGFIVKNPDGALFYHPSGQLIAARGKAKGATKQFIEMKGEVQFNKEGNFELKSINVSNLSKVVNAAKKLLTNEVGSMNPRYAGLIKSHKVAEVQGVFNNYFEVLKPYANIVGEKLTEQEKDDINSVVDTLGQLLARAASRKSQLNSNIKLVIGTKNGLKTIKEVELPITVHGKEVKVNVIPIKLNKVQIFLQKVTNSRFALRNAKGEIVRSQNSLLNVFLPRKTNTNRTFDHALTRYTVDEIVEIGANVRDENFPNGLKVIPYEDEDGNTKFEVYPAHEYAGMEDEIAREAAGEQNAVVDKREVVTQNITSGKRKSGKSVTVEKQEEAKLVESITPVVEPVKQEQPTTLVDPKDERKKIGYEILTKVDKAFGNTELLSAAWDQVSKDESVEATPQAVTKALDKILKAQYKEDTQQAKQMAVDFTDDPTYASFLKPLFELSRKPYTMRNALDVNVGVRDIRLAADEVWEKANKSEKVDPVAELSEEVDGLSDDINTLIEDLYGAVRTDRETAELEKLQDQTIAIRDSNLKNEKDHQSAIDKLTAIYEKIQKYADKYDMSVKDKASTEVISEIKEFASVDTLGSEALSSAEKNLGIILGVKIKVFKHNNKNFNGFFKGNTLYVNANSTMGIEWSLGHEAGHAIQQYAPKVWQELVDSMNISQLQINKFKDNLPLNIYKNDNMIKAEIINDAIGNMFKTGNLFNKLANKNQSLYQKVMQVLKRWYGKLMSKSKSLLTNNQQQKIKNIIEPILLGKQQSTISKILNNNSGAIRVGNLGFYSQLENVIDDMNFKSMPVSDLKNKLNRLDSVKREEIDDIGLIDYLDHMDKYQDGKISKQQVIEYIQDNSVKLKEVQAVDPEPYTKWEDKRLVGTNYNIQEKITSEGKVFNIYDGTFKYLGSHPTLNVAKRMAARWANQEYLEKNNLNATEFDMLKEENSTVPMLSSRVYKNFREVNLVLQNNYRDEVEYVGPHFKTPNVLVNFFLEDVIENRKKILKIQEIQSDWNQQGKSIGYALTKEKIDVKSAEFDSEIKELNIQEVKLRKELMAFPARDRYADNYNIVRAKLDEIINKIGILERKQSQMKYIPDTSMKKSSTWSGLGFKRILNMAVNENYSKIEWNIGDVVADKEGIEADDTKRRNGMKGFYDDIFYNTVKKYIKRLDKNAIVEYNEDLKVYSVTITPTMKDSVMAGQPLYSVKKESKKISDQEQQMARDAQNKTNIDIHRRLVEITDPTLLKEFDKQVEEYESSKDAKLGIHQKNTLNFLDNWWRSPSAIFAKIDKMFPEFKGALTKLWQAGKESRNLQDDTREEWSKVLNTAWSRIDTEQKFAEFTAVRRLDDSLGMHVSQPIQIPVGTKVGTDVTTGLEKDVPTYKYVVIDSAVAGKEQAGHMSTWKSRTEAEAHLKAIKELYAHTHMATVPVSSGERYTVLGWHGDRVFNDAESAYKFANARTKQLLDARGFDPSVTQSYIDMSRWYDQVYDLVSIVHKKTGLDTPAKINGYLPHYVDNWVFSAEYMQDKIPQKHMASFPAYSDAQRYAAQFLSEFGQFDPKFNIIGRKEFGIAQSRKVNTGIDGIVTAEEMATIDKMNELTQTKTSAKEYLDLVTDVDVLFDEKIMKILEINSREHPEGLTVKQWLSKFYGGTKAMVDGQEKKIKVSHRGFNKPTQELRTLLKKLVAQKDAQTRLIKSEDLRKQYISTGGKNRSVTFMKQRQNTGAYSLDMRRVDYKYMMAMSRYITMLPWKKRATSLYQSMFKSDFNDKAKTDFQKWFQQYIHDVNGDPTVIEQKINEWMEDIPIMKQYLSGHDGRWSLQAVNAINEFNMITKLGWNMSSAMMQFSTLLNVYAKLGARWTSVGMSKAVKLSAKDAALIKEMRVSKAYSEEMDAAYNQMHRTSPGNNMFMKFAKKGMGVFYMADQKARQISALAGYYAKYNQLKALPEAERHKQSVKYGMEIQDLTNFDSSIWDAPGIMRYGGPMSKLLMQFKTFGLKQLEFTFGHLKGAEKVRFWTAFVLIAGLSGIPLGDWFNQMVRGFTNNKIDIMAETKKEIYKMIDNKTIPESVGMTLMYGILGNSKKYGVDVTGRIGMYDYMPTNMSSILGPTVSSLWTIKDIFVGSPIDNLTSASSNVVRAFMPGIGNAMLAMEGESINPRDRARLDIKYTPYESTMRFMGFLPTRESEERTIKQLGQNQRISDRSEVSNAIDRYLANPNDKDNQKELSRLKITRNQVKMEMEAKKQTRGERALGMIPKKNRADYKYLSNRLKEEED